MGGMERASCNLANALVDYDCDVVYISLFNQEKFFKLSTQVKFIEPNNFNIKSLSILKTLPWLRRKVKENQPSVIIIFNKFYSAISLLSLLNTKNKVFISERSSPLFNPGLKVKIISRLIFWLISPYAVIAQTRIAADYQKKYYGSRIKVHIIPNVLRSIKLYPEIEREKIILAVGRLSDPLKGFDRLVEAFARVQNKDWKLVFAGSHNEAVELKKIINRLNISNRVEFLGSVKEVDMVYAKSSIFVIPSRSEGFPNALCEAMSAGLPCISYDFIAGPEDIIQNGYDGIIVENGNIDELSKAIDELILDRRKRSFLGKNAQERIKRFNKKRVIQDLKQIILES